MNFAGWFLVALALAALGVLLAGAYSLGVRERAALELPATLDGPFRGQNYASYLDSVTNAVATNLSSCILGIAMQQNWAVNDLELLAIALSLYSAWRTLAAVRLHRHLWAQIAHTHHVPDVPESRRAAV